MIVVALASCLNRLELLLLLMLVRVRAGKVPDEAKDEKETEGDWECAFAAP